MALAIWPAALPQRALVDGYSEPLRNSRLTSNVDVGPPKMRFKGLMPRTVEAQLVLSYALKSTLENFYYSDLMEGTLPFKIPDQTHDDQELLDTDFVELTDDADIILTGTYFWLAAFQSPPVFRPVGVQWMAGLSLTVYPDGR